MYVIYGLIDPRDNTVHYVGQTNDVYTRFRQHINGDGGFAKNAWIFELRAANRMVIMKTLEEVETSQEAIEREAYWIKHFEMLKAPLLNIVHRARKEDQEERINVSRALALLRDARKAKERSLSKSREVSEEDEQSILTAALSLQNAGVNVTREAIKNKLGWNNRKHDIVKSVCDKHEIAVCR